MCLYCDRGTYVDIKRQIACYLCQEGTYNPFTGSFLPSDCQNCPAHTYNKYKGKIALSDCLPCPPGTFNLDFGQKACKGMLLNNIIR